ncbi:hypothetical protein SSX86_015974 [Deinandra increscens subsp. villosa]|uniref:H15 domain-containing protein n=1 Tax=Deinandra increscens subsp. villosa TaxID=3103831 RepID=A0AAP0D2F8_9ASTR
MENLKEALIQFAHSNPSLFPNDASADSCSMLIEQCFPQFFPDLHTPNHPPYAAMIYRAIWELNKKRGSSEKSISKFIKKEYADLPWAHPTLLKHHLEKLCDRNEIRMTDKQCYLLAGAESELGMKISEPSKKRKKQKRQPGSEKKIGRPHKKYKKIENCELGIQETNEKEQIGILKRKRKQGLKPKKKRSKGMKKQQIYETKLQLFDEANLKQKNDESHEQKMLEVNRSDLQIQEQIGTHKRKRKQGLKSKRKRSKGMKKHEINEAKLQLLDEANLKQKNDESHEQTQMLEVNRCDMQIQEQNEAGQELCYYDSDCINLKQIQTNKNPELLQLEESPDSNPISHENGKRVWTRSQLKTVSKKDALAASSELTGSAGYENMPNDKLAIVEYVSNEEQEKSRSPSSEKPLIELLKSISSKLKATRFPDDEPTEVQDLVNSQQDQQPEKLTIEDKPKYKGRGRHPKRMEPKKEQVLRNSKSAKKGKVGKKKVQPKYKRDGRHKMTRRSGRNVSC